MKYALLPESLPVQPLPFYLAMEEYLARTFDEEFFFMWQVEPTVICGRNQRVENEVNLDYCKAHGINIVRRKSGGGCVFADMKNIMFSYITSTVNVPTTFSRYTGKVAAMLRTLGLNAEANGRNDVLIDGKKVSGNAFYHLSGRSIVHGTMLFDTDMEHISRALSPSPEKLASKGVPSVRSRVTMLKDHLTMDIEQFKSFARKAMCDADVLILGDADVQAINGISRSYYDREWLYGRHNPSGKSISHRIDGVGDFAIDLALDGGRVGSIDITGDFFLLGDIETEIISRLKGVKYNSADLLVALDGVAVDKVIAGIDNKQFINLLF